MDAHTKEQNGSSRIGQSGKAEEGCRGLHRKALMEFRRGNGTSLRASAYTLGGYCFDTLQIILHADNHGLFIPCFDESPQIKKLLSEESVL